MAFHVSQMQPGVFYGLWVEGYLVAAAGTHLLSPTYGLAAVGNVFTHPSYRRKGYGLAATSAVVSALLETGIRDIVLNVSQKNLPAVRIYERLGFERYCPFLEGPASM
jgi:predicted GNAT family acetyltransferase